MTEPASTGSSGASADRVVVLRAVLDTNVPIAAHLTRNPRSPTVELLQRWRGGEFVQLYSDDMLVELVEKFQTRQIAEAVSARYVADLITLGEHVIIAPEQVPNVIPADPDDNMILACALVGCATHIVTYDPHFDILGGAYASSLIVDGLHFLYVVRGDRPPDAEGLASG